ncbi:MAG: polysaccharide deacetylase family protein [Clostridia bacterium]
MKIRKRYLALAIIMFILAGIFLGLNIYFASSNIVIYMYHSVREEPVNPDADELSVRPSEFEKQLEFFSSRKIKTIFADQLKGLNEKHSRYAVLTFDDGYEDNYTEVFPLLKKYNCKATIFMIASKIDKEGYLSSEQIREMTESGLVSVQSHTVSHEPLALGDKEYEEVVYELGESKSIIEAVSGAPVDVVSMPNGSFDGVVIDIAKEYYDVIFTGDSFRAYSPEDILDVHRVGIYRRHTIDDVRKMTDHRGMYVIKRGVQKLLGM